LLENYLPRSVITLITSKISLLLISAISFEISYPIEVISSTQGKASGMCSKAPMPIESPMKKSLISVSFDILDYKDYSTAKTNYYYVSAPLTYILMISPNLLPATKKSVSY